MHYKRIYDSIIEKAKTRLTPEGYVEHHHIIPKCMGGSNNKKNIVALTPEEHFLCHVLLVKIYPKQSGLIYAANKMCRGHKGKRKNRKLYGWLKRKYSEQRKIDSAGQGNPQYGTMWVNKIGTTENKKIKKNEPIPEGWGKGRKMPVKDVFYIHNPVLMECVTIETGTSIPDGWLKGRVRDWDIYFGKKKINRVTAKTKLSPELQKRLENKKNKPRTKNKITRINKKITEQENKNKADEILDFIFDNNYTSVAALMRDGYYKEFGYRQKLTAFLKRYNKERFQKLIKPRMIGKIKNKIIVP